MRSSDYIRWAAKSLRDFATAKDIGYDTPGSACYESWGVESATEAAVVLLRIDDVLVAGDLEGGRIDADDDVGGPPVEIPVM